MSAVLDVAAVERRHVRMRNTVLCRLKCHLVFGFGASKLALVDCALRGVGKCRLRFEIGKRGAPF